MGIMYTSFIMQLYRAIKEIDFFFEKNGLYMINGRLNDISEFTHQMDYYLFLKDFFLYG